MKKNILRVFTLLFFGSFTSWIFWVAGAQGAFDSTPHSKNFRIKSHLQFDKELSGKAYAIDGDSLKVGGNEVRLFGLDAPEYSQTCFDATKKEYKCGTISHTFLINLAGGKKVTCKYAEKDKYDRFLGKCSVNEVSINQELVGKGMAVIYNFTESDERMDELEAEAKEKKLGIWQGAFQLPKDYRKAHPRNQ